MAWRVEVESDNSFKLFIWRPRPAHISAGNVLRSQHPPIHHIICTLCPHRYRQRGGNLPEQGGCAARPPRCAGPGAQALDRLHARNPVLEVGCREGAREEAGGSPGEGGPRQLQRRWAEWERAAHWYGFGTQRFWRQRVSAASDACLIHPQSLPFHSPGRTC